MTAVPFATVLVVLLVGSAVGGPWLLRRAAPVLVRTPRLAVGLLIGSIIGWLGALLAVGPVIAWITSGPTLFTGRAADVCQRCLASANPFTGGTVPTVVPSVLLVALPALAALMIAASVIRHSARRHLATRAMGEDVATRATGITLAGHRVLLVPDAEAVAFTLPRRHGGIVISAGTLRVLDDAELAAVLAHEEAHLRQRHHVVTTLVESLARPWRWIPLVSAAADAVPHYLEIAADNAARERVGTPALVSALLTLGESQRSVHAASPSAAGNVLHAVGPNRIRHLVTPGRSRAGAGSAFASVVHTTALGAAGVGTLMAYLVATLTVCT